MPKGISLHIGINRVDPKHYEGWNGKLNACEQDAQDMQALAESLGYAPNILLTKDATARKVTAAIKKAAAALEPGDVFLITFSGHGGQVPDKNGDEAMATGDEFGEFADQYDETWVLYDRMLVDDEMYALWATFPSKVRIIMLSDSCHSGSVAKLTPWEVPGDSAAPRRIPLAREERVYAAHKAQYDRIQRRVPARTAAKLAANVVLISGCMDNQSSYDGDVNGRFTARLLTVWNQGKFKGVLRKLHQGIVAGMPSYQTPNFYRVGPTIRGFANKQAFRI
jgi:hypothetical protein